MQARPPESNARIALRGRIFLQNVHKNTFYDRKNDIGAE
jgi:hypothetical protein